MNDLEKTVFEEGRRDYYRNNLDLEDNPYPPQTKEHTWWKNGNLYEQSIGEEWEENLL